MLHQDHVGNRDELVAGSVQWMTAGRGIIHLEMLGVSRMALMWGFQLWVNLPALHKMTAPRYQDIPPEKIPEATLAPSSQVGSGAGRYVLLFFAGAGISPAVWRALEELAVETIGMRVPILTGLGATETAPFAMVCDLEHAQPGRVGLPVPGVELKLVPVDGKMEARVRAPSVTPGYWREPALTAAAFDEDGYYRLGDALAPVDEADLSKGYVFDGRINEDFKLSSGTWVSAGPLRAAILQQLAPLARDVIVTGLNRDDIGILIFPDSAAVAALAPGLRGDELIADPRVRDAFARKLGEVAARATGSSNRVSRAIILAEPPDIDKGELTDKGTISQKAVLANRAGRVDELYAEPPSPRVLRA